MFHYSLNVLTRRCESIYHSLETVHLLLRDERRQFTRFFIEQYLAIGVSQVNFRIWLLLNHRRLTQGLGSGMALFGARASRQRRTVPSFLGVTTKFEIHSDGWFTGSIKSFSKSFSNSLFIFSLRLRG